MQRKNNLKADFVVLEFSFEVFISCSAWISFSKEIDRKKEDGPLRELQSESYSITLEETQAL